MTKQPILRILILILLVFQFQTPSLAQQKTRLGLNLTTNFDQYSNFKPEIGFVFERQITKHSGLETGINYRTYQQNFLFIIDNQSTYPTINEMFISIPISYKFYSKIVNVGLGITYDYYLGWKQLGGSTEMTSYLPGDDYFMGFIGKISRQISLGDNFILEPEIKFNLLIIPYERHYIGFGLVAKFDLHKE
jgi:hypothetical protein